MFQISLTRENNEHQQRNVNKFRECGVGTVTHRSIKGHWQQKNKYIQNQSI